MIGRELDWQCNWNQLRSIQASYAAITISSWSTSNTSNISEDDLLDVADALMLDDVIKRQKLEAEIEEGEEALAMYLNGDNVLNKCDDDKLDVVSEDKNIVDLTPSLRGTQTLSLTENGDWKSDGVSDSVPLQGGEEMPPPPPPSRNFYDRFLLGRSSNSDALKEIQKLKWTKYNDNCTNCFI